MTHIYLKTGEFAALCGTTKDTLFHYDAIGLLKPAKIAANGYRYYATYQVLLVDIISLLKELGLSLEEIKQYIIRRNALTCLHMLKETDKKLREEIERLERLRRLLNNTIAVTQDAFRVKIDTIKFFPMKEEYFIITAGPSSNDEKSIFEAIRVHVEYCARHNFYHAFTHGEIIGETAIADKTYATQYYATRLNKKVKNKHLLIKPAGIYAVTYVQCSYDDLTFFYNRFARKLQDKGCTLCGHMYQEDMLNYLSETDDERYLMKLEIRVLA